MDRKCLIRQGEEVTMDETPNSGSFGVEHKGLKYRVIWETYTLSSPAGVTVMTVGLTKLTQAASLYLQPTQMSTSFVPPYVVILKQGGEPHETASLLEAARRHINSL